MTDETTQALLPVTQADRDAAASINPQYFNTSTARAANMAETAAIKNGSLDHHENVQAFARHRLAHSLPSQADAGEEMLREVLVDHFPTGLRGSYERTAGGIVVDTGMKTDCHCGWSAQASDEHEVRDLWARHVAATLTAPPTSGEEMRLREAEHLLSAIENTSSLGAAILKVRRRVAALTKGAE